MHEADNPIRSTRISMRMLEAVHELETATVTELHRELDVSTSVVHDHLATLMEEGYVVRDGYEYRVGAKFLQYGATARRSYPVYEEAAATVDEIAEATGDQVNLVFEENGKGIVVYQRNGDQAANTGLQTGSIVDLHCSAAGKAILAFSRDEFVTAVIDHYGLPEWSRYTITNPEELREDIDGVGGDHPWVTYDRGERARGVKSIGTPLVDSSVNLLGGAISVTMPNSRFEAEDHREEIIELLEMKRPIISTNISYE
jgi:DNA-binding IclR family transcriptional regulator